MLGIMGLKRNTIDTIETIDERQCKKLNQSRLLQLKQFDSNDRKSEDKRSCNFEGIASICYFCEKTTSRHCEVCLLPFCSLCALDS